MHDYQTVSKVQKSGVKARYILALILFAFIGGAILSVWAADRLNLLGSRQGSSAQNISAKTLSSASYPAFEARPKSATEGNDPELPMTDRVSDLEAGLSRINAQAAFTTANTARAEGLLLAFAARRAIESGAGLGYTEDQLSNRFSATEPAAVREIVQALQNPVTLDELREQLSSEGPKWLTPAGMTAWGKFKREIGELFILRQETTPSPAPSRRLERAKQFAEVGNIEAALKEVRNLPGKTQAADWMDNAYSYVSARAALDRIERAAMAKPALKTLPEVPIAPEQNVESQQPQLEPDAAAGPAAPALE
jgi:hypothetical protein